MPMNYKKFLEAWNDLDRSDKIACFNEYAREYRSDDELFEFDEDFFNTFFADNPTEAVRSCFFGNIQNWSDEYIRFDGYGNLVSMSEWEAEEWADDYKDEIYECEDIWSRYIDADDYEDDNEEDKE